MIGSPLLSIYIPFVRRMSFTTKPLAKHRYFVGHTPALVLLRTLQNESCQISVQSLSIRHIPVTFIHHPLTLMFLLYREWFLGLIFSEISLKESVFGGRRDNDDFSDTSHLTHSGGRRGGGSYFSKDIITNPNKIRNWLSD